MSVIGSNILAGASGGAGGAEYTIERSLRFNSSDSAHLDKNFASAGNRRTFTFSCWVKRSALTASGEYIFTSSDLYSKAITDQDLFNLIYILMLSFVTLQPGIALF